MAAKFSLEIPPGQTLERLIELLNDRMRTIQQELEAPIKLDADMDAAGNRIVNLGDARAGTDALNRNSADRRYLQTQPGAAASGGGSNTTTIVQTGGGGNLLLLSVAGILSIRSSAAPLAMLAESKSGTKVQALLKQGPVGADLKVKVLVGGADWAQVTVPAGNVRAEVSGSLGQIAAGAAVTVDIVAVGTTFPGADLTLGISLA